MSREMNAFTHKLFLMTANMCNLTKAALTSFIDHDTPKATNTDTLSEGALPSKSFDKFPIVWALSVYYHVWGTLLVEHR